MWSRLVPYRWEGESDLHFPASIFRLAFVALVLFGLTAFRKQRIWFANRVVHGIQLIIRKTG